MPHCWMRCSGKAPRTLPSIFTSFRPPLLTYTSSSALRLPARGVGGGFGDAMDDEKKAAGRDDRPPPSRGRPARGRAFRILQVRLELLYALHDAPRGKARRLVARPSRVVVWPSALTNARGGGHHVQDANGRFVSQPHQQGRSSLRGTPAGRARPAPQRRRANAPMSGVFDGDENIS